MNERMNECFPTISKPATKSLYRGQYLSMPMISTVTTCLLSQHEFASLQSALSFYM